MWTLFKESAYYKYICYRFLQNSVLITDYTDLSLPHSFSLFIFTIHVLKYLQILKSFVHWYHLITCHWDDQLGEYLKNGHVALTQEVIAAQRWSSLQFAGFSFLVSGDFRRETRPFDGQQWTTVFHNVQRRSRLRRQWQRIRASLLPRVFDVVGK